MVATASGSARNGKLILTMTAACASTTYRSPNTGGYVTKETYTSHAYRYELTV